MVTTVEKESVVPVTIVIKDWVIIASTLGSFVASKVGWDSSTHNTSRKSDRWRLLTFIDANYQGSFVFFDPTE